MTADARLFITEFPKVIWQLFTGVKIPGLNFSPAVFFFGILTFGIALKFLLSILHITAFFGHDNRTNATVIERYRRETPENRYYQRQR